MAHALSLGGPRSGKSRTAQARAATWLANAAGRQAGPGLAPMSAEVRRFMDALGGLHPQVAALCGRVTLMVAGCVRVLKHAAA